MAKNKKKQADETLVDIIEIGEQAQDFYQKYQYWILGVVGGLALLIIGWVAFNNFYLKPKQDEAVEQMFQAQTQFERDSFRLALLDPGGGYPGFVQIIEDYPGTKAANTAHYYAGVSYLYLGKYDAALDYLQDFKPKDDIMPAMKWGAMGDAYAELQKMDQAMNFYQKAANAGKTEVIAAYYLKKVGLLHEKNQNFEEAAKAYRTIKEKYPESIDARDIDKYIIRAEAAKGQG